MLALEDFEHKFSVTLIKLEAYYCSYIALYDDAFDANCTMDRLVVLSKLEYADNNTIETRFTGHT